MEDYNQTSRSQVKVLNKLFSILLVAVLISLFILYSTSTLLSVQPKTPDTNSIHPLIYHHQTKFTITAHHEISNVESEPKIKESEVPKIESRYPVLETEPKEAPVTVLNFFYLKMTIQTNFTPLCNLSFDCIFTQDDYRQKQHWTNYSAIMVFGNPAFHRLAKLVGKEHDLMRDPRQLWIARGKESSASIWNFVGLKGPIHTAFNYTVGVSTKATFRDSYFSIIDRKDQRKTMSQIEKEYDSFQKDKDFCWMVTQCHVFNKRFDLAAQIINALPGKIHMWGKALRVCMPEVNKSKVIDHGFTDRNTVESQFELSKCKFYFSFENSNCSDYVTEKFSNALAKYSIPIVNGWRESYEKLLPGSFIHPADFQSPVHLAEHLSRLLANKTELLAYHKWRLKYDVLKEDQLSMYNELPCRVCEKVYKTREANKKALTNIDTITDLAETFRNMQQCSPR